MHTIACIAIFIACLPFIVAVFMGTVTGDFLKEEIPPTEDENAENAA